MTTLAQTELYCTLWVDGLNFGIPVRHVQEVLRYQQMSRVPGACEAVFGLINLRGEIVPAIDLRHRLGLAPRTTDRSPMNVVVQSRNEVVSLLVDDIGDVIDTGGTAIEPVPPTLPAIVRDVITGVIPLPQAILLILDVDKAADVFLAHPS